MHFMYFVVEGMMQYIWEEAQFNYKYSVVICVAQGFADLAEQINFL